MDGLERAIAAWLAYVPGVHVDGPVTPPVTWEVGPPGSAIEFGEGDNPLDGAVLSGWVKHE